MTHNRNLLDTAPLDWRVIPRRDRLTTLAAAALAWRHDAFAHIADHLTPPCTRQHVAGVAYGERTSKRIEKALRMAVARQRYP